MGLLGSIFERCEHSVDCLDPEYVDLAQLRFRPGRAFVLHVAVGVDQNGAPVSLHSTSHAICVKGAEIIRTISAASLRSSQPRLVITKPPTC